MTWRHRKNARGRADWQPGELRTATYTSLPTTGVPFGLVFETDGGEGRLLIDLTPEEAEILVTNFAHYFQKYHLGKKVGQ